MSKGPRKKVIVKKNGKTYYSHMRAAWDDIRNDYLFGGMKMKQIYEKYLPLCEKPFAMTSLNTLIVRDKLPKLRKEYLQESRLPTKRDKTKALVKAEQDGTVARELVDTAIRRVKRGAHRHFNRQEKLLNKAHGVLDRSIPNQKSVGEFLTNIDKYDSMARRLYNMDNDEEMDSHKRDVTILINVDNVIDQQEEKEAKVVEVS